MRFGNLRSSNKFIWLFSSLLALTIGGYALIYYLDMRGKTDAVAIDIAGKNRMLSQRMMALAQTLVYSDLKKETIVNELRKTIEEHEDALNLLKNGGTALSLGQKVKLDNAEFNFVVKIAEIEAILSSHKSIIQKIIIGPIHREEVNDSSMSTVPSSKKINPEIVSAIEKLQKLSLSGELLKNNMALTAMYVEKAKWNKSMFVYALALLIIVNVIAISIAFILIQRHVIIPIYRISKVARKIATGDINANLNIPSKDDLGEIAGSINLLTNNLRKAAEFIVNLGKGNFNAHYDAVQSDQLDESQNLSLALHNMRERLQKVTEDDKKRNWAVEGLSELGSLLRAAKSAEWLYNDLIKFIVRYTDSAVGGIFLIDPYVQSELELMSCFAYGSGYSVHKKYNSDEGLIGQCFMENETIILDQVPAGYLEISSTLGESDPNTLLLVPLKSHGKAYGVLELASFAQYPAHVIEFIEKIASDIASALLTTRSNEQTRALLEKAQEQTAQLKAQEEEMRQNVEELQSTQEQLLRNSQHEKEDLGQQIKDQLRETQLRDEVLGQTTILSETDPYGTIIYVNQKFIEVSKFTSQELIGKPHNIVRHPDMPKELFQLFWDTIKKGKVFKGILKNRAKDGSHYWVDATIVPILNDQGEIEKFIGARYHLVHDHLAEEMYAEQAKKLGLPTL